MILFKYKTIIHPILFNLKSWYYFHRKFSFRRIQGENCLKKETTTYYYYCSLNMFTYATTNIWHICIICGCQALSTFKFDHLEKEKFQRSYSRSTASSSAWIYVVIWWYSLVCSTLCSKSSSSKTHTLNNTFSHWIFFVVCVAWIAFVLCTHQNSASNTSSSSASFQKSRKFNFSYDQQHGQQKKSTARRMFLTFTTWEICIHFGENWMVFHFFI